MTQRLERVQTTGFRITPKSTEPISPTENDIYLDDGTNTASGEVGFRRYTGAAWEDIGGGTGGGGSGSAATDPVFHIGGVLATASEVDGAWIAPRPSTIQYVYIYCRDPGSASSTIVDVNLNGTTIFTTQGNRPTLAYDDADQVAKSGVPDVTALVENDVLSVDIDQVGTDAEDLTVIVALEVTPTDAADITYTPAVAADWDSGVDPGDVDDALDQLAERVDDLEAAGGGGNVTSADAEGSEPGSPSEGDLFFPTNGFYVKRYSGSAWQPWGPLFPLTKPVLADFAWINQGTATVTDYGALSLYAPAVSGDQIRILKKPAPSTPYTIIVCFLPTLLDTNYMHLGLVWRQSSDGKLVTFQYSQSGFMNVNKFNNPTSYNNAYYVSPAIPLRGPVWFRAQDTGTVRICSVSGDGVNWMQLHSVGRTDFLTADEIGFYANSNNSTYPAAINLLSWYES